MNTTASIRRRIAAGVIAAIVVPTFAACGNEVTPPAQNIGGTKVQKKDAPAPRAPKRTTGNRYDFDDEYGTARPRTHTHQPAGSGTRNRMDFGDTGVW